MTLVVLIMTTLLCDRPVYGFPQQAISPISSDASRTSSKSSSSSLNLSAVTGGLDLFFQAHPFATAFLAGGTQASVADWVAQSRERLSQNRPRSASSSNHKRQPWYCPRRNLSFLLYGGLYQGMANEFIFNRLLPSLIQHKLLQALVAVFVFGSFLSLPIAYTIKAVVFGHHDGMARYWHDVTHQGLLRKFWSVWVPVNLLNFGWFPSHYRITVNSIVDFCWLMILSSISSRKTSSPAAEPINRVQQDTMSTNRKRKSLTATVPAAP